MPQASDELRAEMRTRFGDIDLHGPQEYLKAKGWTLHDNWQWSKPGVTNLGVIPRDEFDCLVFLVHEWDYGGVKGVLS